jgi:hypothetical protein
MIQASRLDVRTYEEVEADRSSNSAAVVIVILASVAAAIGSGVRDLTGMIAATVVLILTWLIWIGLTYFIGTRLLPDSRTHADVGEVLRTTGFSAAPGVLRILGVIPGLGLPIFIAVTIWMLMTFVVAIRQALDFASFGRALAVCALGWVLHWLLLFAFVRTAI